MAAGTGAGDPNALPPDWAALLGAELTMPYFQKLSEFVTAERAANEVFPPPEDVFNAFRYTPVDSVRVLLLGQDPYHDNNQAHGLCFSVRHGIAIPPSLKNIYKELQSDLGISPPKHGCLEAWAKRGVLLMNAVLTVRAHEANSHKDQGWERFTDAVIRTLSARSQPIVFVLWGGYAQKKVPLIDQSRHRIIQSAHPSPLSVKKFLGTRPFSQINDQLEQWGQSPIDWQLPAGEMGATD
ncbi:uracil-DNA glycosylase [Tuwongella immobilis]|uniref:uracil-DNA glycosylase n=1 Tax=Tuwongella immobilis TaxID=692036 RepID=UPI0036F2628A